MKNRKGKITIHEDLFKDDEGLLMLSELFSKFVPFFIRESFTGKEYFGVSSHFDEFEVVGAEVPSYDVIIQQSLDVSNNRSYCVNFKKL